MTCAFRLLIKRVYASLHLTQDVKLVTAFLFAVVKLTARVSIKYKKQINKKKTTAVSSARHTLLDVAIGLSITGASVQ